MVILLVCQGRMGGYITYVYRQDEWPLVVEEVIGHIKTLLTSFCSRAVITMAVCLVVCAPCCFCFISTDKNETPK